MSYKILAIDDDEFNLEVVASCLDDKYQVHCLTSGVNCQKVITDFKPDLILLDILMPDMDGFTICQQLKQNDDTALIPVVFLSALGDAADRIEGFACGAEDYITKPFVMSELSHKVEEAIDRAKKQEAWTKAYEENSSPSQVSDSALEQFYEMGALIKFQQRCSECNEVQELGNEIVSLCRSLGLDANIQLDTHQGKQYVGCRYSSFEAKFLTKTRSAADESEARNREVFKSKHLSILVKNMPREKSVRYGRFRDHLEMLVKTASNRLEILDLEDEQKSNTHNIVQNLENAIFYIEKSFDQHNKNIKTSIDELMSEALDHLTHLDNQDEHVERINYCIAKCLNEISRIGTVGKVSQILNSFMQDHD